MIIAASSSKIAGLPGSPIQLVTEDIAIASLALCCTGASLRHYLTLYTQEITKETLAEVQREKAALVAETDPSYIAYRDGFFVVFVDNMSWETIVLVWSMHLALNKKQTYYAMNKYVEDLRYDLYSHRKNMEEMRNKIAYAKRINQAPYFNSRGFLKQCKNLKISFKVVGDKIGLIFTDVTLGNDTEGKIRYDRILLILDNQGAIDGFFLFFKDFSFSSYWDLPGVVLHPYLSRGYGFNASLSFCDKNDSKDYAEAIRDTVLEYHPNSGIKHVEQIVRDFQEIRKYWAGLKHTETDDLSKLVFAEFSKSLVIPEITTDEEEDFGF